MPTVEIDPDELRTLTGETDRDDETLIEDLFGLGMEFEGRTEDGELELEFAPDRLDRLSVEGVARSLRYHYGVDSGITVPSTLEPEWTIAVEESVPDDRPYVTGAVVRGIDLDERKLESLIQLQEKLHATIGRGRAKGAIGVHDLTMLKGAAASGGDPTVRYVGVEPEEDRFVPLEADDEYTPGEVLTDHPTGRTYADVVEGYGRMPAIYDDIGLFSFPPIINGRRTEVTTDSRDLLIEMTGTDQWTIDAMLSIVCYALSARGATVEAVRIQYPDDRAGSTGTALERPDLEPKRKRVSHDRIETVLGIDLDPEDVLELAERSGLEAVREDEGYEVTVPAYRTDVLHPIDVVDDLGRAYGFNELEPVYPDVGTVGGTHPSTRLEDAVRTQLVGLGFEDLLNFHLIGEDAAYDRLDVSPGENHLGGGEPVRITEPYSEDFAIVRQWVLPSLLLVLENNTHRAYPQDLAEVGFVAERDATAATGVAERRHVGGVIARHDAGYEDARSRLQSLARNFGVDLETPPTDHPSFLDGRVATIRIDGENAGVVGELHPRVLVEHDLEVPVAAFEFDLETLGDR